MKIVLECTETSLATKERPMPVFCIASIFFFLSACFGAYWNEWNCMDYDGLAIDDDDDKYEDNHHDITTLI